MTIESFPDTVAAGVYRVAIATFGRAAEEISLTWIKFPRPNEGGWYGAQLHG
jgi:hypothetical protein